MLDKLHHLYNWVLPRICVGCGFSSDDPYVDLCKFCKVHLPWFKDGCIKCGANLENVNASIICEDCVNQPPPFDRVYALFKYEPPLNGLVNKLKFHEQLIPASFFAQLFFTAVTQDWYADKPLPQAIIPVPLHQKRLLNRGYNQALEISLPLGKALNLPVRADLCQKTRNTPPQARLKREMRLNNLRNAFKAQNSNFSSVAIVDDVVTTGSTVRAMSYALHAAGIQQIDVWCVCR